MKNIKIGPKLIMLFLLIGLLPLGITGIMNMNKAGDALMAENTNKLMAVREIKQSQITQFFAERQGDAKVLANNPFTQQAMVELGAVFKEGGGTQGGQFSGSGNFNFNGTETYREVHQKFFSVFKHYMEEYGYYDLFLIDAADGGIAFSVFKEPDFGKSARSIGGNIADVWQKAAAGSTALSDINPYAPSNGVPAIFVASPIQANGRTLGVLALQISTEAIDKMMQEAAGMGESGENYLVGADFKMRSNSRLSKEPTLLKQEVKTATVEKGLSGQSGCEVTPDYRGINVLSCYDQIELGSTKWAMMSEIDESEAEQATIDVRNMILMMSGIFAAAVLLIAVFFSRSIAKPLSSMSGIAGELAKGNIDQEVHVNSKDEIGELGIAFQQLVEAQQQKAHVAEQIAKGNMEITVDVLSDEDTLGASMDTLKQSIQRLIDEMNHMADEHNAGDIDIVVPVEEFDGAFRAMAQGVNDMVNGHITVKKKAMACVAEFGKGNFDAELEQFPGKKAFINDTIEAVRGNIKRFISDMERMSREHDAGDIDVIIPAETFEGAFHAMAQGVNDMVNGHLTVKKKAMACVAEFGNGNFDAPLEQFPGKKAFINETIEAVRSNLKGIADELNSLIRASQDGRLEVRADAKRFDGDWEKLLLGVNDIVEAIINPIAEAARVLEDLSNYDLRVRVKGDYKGDHAKIKESLNATGEALHDAMRQVAEAVEQVTSASTQIASSSQQVAEGSSEQASSLEETSSSLEEMSGMTKQNADNTQQARGLAENTRSAADKGAGAMTNMMSSMGKIKSAAEGTAEIIKDINEIAFQTNLLALNAAVEAARAGDAGRGFAVVAEEVRNLAGRAKDAAKNTEELIKESVSLADEGEKISSDVNSNLSEIVESVAKVTDLVGEIAVASQEQARGIDQVNKAMNQMDKVVQQSAANSEESSSAAEELAGQAQELAAMVGRFQMSRSSSTKQRKSAGSKPVARGAVQVSEGSSGGNGAGAMSFNPEEVIPMDNDPDFAEF